jgi:amidophosphoribosyltransferase
MCGILGIYGYDDISRELVYGLTALQHRGQDAAGVVTFDQRFRLQKGLGTISHVFCEDDLKKLPGYIGIGHVRYATQGRNDVPDAQPFAVNYPFGLAMVHNGNVLNFGELRRMIFEQHHRLLETSSDLELILYMLAAELERKDLTALSTEDLFSAVEAVQERVVGAYATITIIANRGMLAFNDPRGMRPLVMGKKCSRKGVVYALASETNCFDYLGFESCGDLAPGEAILIDASRNVHRRVCRARKPAFCVFEYIYLAREDSILHGRLVAGERVRMGKRLAKAYRQAGIEADCIIDVPSSGYFFASGMAEELGIPYRRGLAKNNYVGRSFISPTEDERAHTVRQKLNPIRDVIRGRRVAVVDDSIVRGTTSRHLVKLLRDAGAEKVFFVSASPPIRYPCVYGVDMSIKSEMIAANLAVPDIARLLGADGVVYLPLEDLEDLYRDLPICCACFSGEYPTGTSKELLHQIEDERTDSKAKDR